MIEAMKNHLVLLAGVSRDALHTQIGLFLFFAVALVFRRQASRWLPLSAVMAAAVASEVFDCLRDLSRYGVWDHEGSIHDIINTVFWPVIIHVMARTGIVFSRQ